MPRLFFGNFEFEHQLADPKYKRPSPLSRLAAELASVWVTVAEDGDLIWTPEPIDSQFCDLLSQHEFARVRLLSSEREVRELGSAIELVPWGWSSPVLEWAYENRFTVNAPSIEAVRHANSRMTSYELEEEFHCGLNGATLIHSVDELVAHLQQLVERRLLSDSTAWVLKAEFSMSARERFLGRGPQLSSQAIQWIRNRLSCSPAVVFEPWVEKIQEWGLQFEIPQTGPPKFLGCTELLTDANGQYRGSRIGFQNDDQYGERSQLHGAIEVASDAAGRLQQAGYFGPLGVDAMIYRDKDGAQHVRPLQDINARMTMGRLALSLERFLRERECGTWLHACRDVRDGDREDWYDRFAEMTADGVHVVPTSPGFVGDRPTSYLTMLIVASSRDVLKKAERDIQTALQVMATK